MAGLPLFLVKELEPGAAEAGAKGTDYSPKLLQSFHFP